MATYDITNHALLSDKAKALQSEDATAFDAHVIGAEFAFEVYGESYSGDKLELVKLILAYQVNYQIENDQDSEVYSEIQEGDRTYKFKDQIPLSPIAQHLNEKLQGEVDVDAEAQEKKQRLGSSGAKSGTVIW